MGFWSGLWKFGKKGVEKGLLVYNGYLYGDAHNTDDKLSSAINTIQAVLREKNDSSKEESQVLKYILIVVLVILLCIGVGFLMYKLTKIAVKKDRRIRRATMTATTEC